MAAITLYEAEGKWVNITLDKRYIYMGLARDYCSAYDNDSLPEAISIGDIEMYVDEIVSIELLYES